MIFLSEMNFDVTFQRALPAESAGIVTHSVKIRLSSKIIPRYLFIVTNYNNLSTKPGLIFCGSSSWLPKMYNWTFCKIYI